MAKTHRIIYGCYEGDGEQNVYLTLLDDNHEQAVLSYERFPDNGNGLFDDEEPVHFSTNVKLDDIRDLYLALSTGDDIARSFYSVDGGTLMVVDVDDGVAMMAIVTSTGKEIASYFDPPRDTVSYMQYGIHKLLEEVE